MLDYVDVNEAMHTAKVLQMHPWPLPTYQLNHPAGSDHLLCLTVDGPLFYHFSVISKLLASKHSVENPYFWQQAAAHANKPL